LLGAAFARTRSDNAHDRRDVALLAVPDAAGGHPAFWPAGGFFRGALFEGAIGDVDALLAGYGLTAGPAGGTPMERRNALAYHLGTMRA
jgi:hypothetical protein